MSKSFIIWTPFHLYNVARYVISNDLVGQHDAFIVVQSEPMKVYSSKVKKCNLFKNVYLTTIEKVRRRQKVWEGISALVSPKLYVKNIFGNRAINNVYDEVYMSVPTRLNDAIIKANKCKEIIGYDDGIGSYMSDLYNISLGRKYERISRLVGRKTYNVRKVLLNLPELQPQSNEERLYCKLIDKKYDGKVVKDIFCYGGNYKPSTVIYLNQPLNEIIPVNDYKDYEKDVIDFLSEKARNDLVIRLHPRIEGNEEYKGLNIDYGEEMWELICEEEISHNNVLISFFSTAQFTPKLLFNKEPTLIFTFNLYSEMLDDIIIENMKKMVELIRGAYKDKGKIIVINKIKDLDFFFRNGIKNT